MAQIADDAFDPLSLREDMAQALSNILDALSDGDSGDEDADDSDLTTTAAEREARIRLSQ